MVTEDDVKRGLEEKRPPTIPNPLVDVAIIRSDEVKVLADNTNEAFSEHLRSKYLEVDETIDFALIWTFAEHPFKDLEDKLRQRGIRRKVKVKKITKIAGVETVEEIEEEQEVRYKSVVLQEFLTDLLKRRHSLNGRRVKQYIDALDAGKIRGMPEMTRAIAPPEQRGRIA